MMFVIDLYMAERSILLSQRKDFTGKRFGFLTVQETLYAYKNGVTYVRCKCDCGNVVLRSTSSITRSEKPSCGCMKNLNNIASRKDVTGEKYGRLTVLEMIWGHGKPKVRCLCDCGNEVIASKTNVVSGGVISCGCAHDVKRQKEWYGYVSEYGVKIIEPYEIGKCSGWKWRCICGLCGSEFYAYPYNVINGITTSCGCASKSSRERLIENLLVKNSIIYKCQFTFDGCKHILKLPFDFAIFNDKGSIITLIEYDGAQHYFPVGIFGGNDNFEKVKRNDKIKDEYCIKNAIPLLRLPYTLTDEEIIEKITNIINP